MSEHTPRGQPEVFASMNVQTRLFVGLTAAFVTCLVLGDVIGGKVADTFVGQVSVGMIPFPITFLLTDVINDFYGARGARFVTLIGFAAAAFAWAVLQLSTLAPTAATSYFTDEVFALVFGGSAQLFVASMLAYLLGQFLDIYVFQFWKRLTRSRYLWIRATGSTLLSQVVDTATINVVFWSGKSEPAWIAAKIVREYGVKVLVAVLLTPAVYALHSFIVARLGIRPAPAELR